MKYALMVEIIYIYKYQVDIPVFQMFWVLPSLLRLRLALVVVAGAVDNRIRSTSMGMVVVIMVEAVDGGAGVDDDDNCDGVIKR